MSTKTKECTPERTASDAAWIAGGALRGHRFNPFLDLISAPSYYDAGEADMWSGIRNDLSHVFDLKGSNFNGYPIEGLTIDCQPGTAFVLASEILDKKLTPTLEPSKKDELFTDKVFTTDTTAVYVIGHSRPWSGTPRCDWAVDHVVKQSWPRPYVVVEEVKNPPRKTSMAFKMFDELREWLNLTTDETARLVGVGRTTPLAWERDGREPRPAHARRLYQVHSIVSALVMRVGVDAAADWLERGSPSQRQRLEEGEITKVARAAERILLQSASRSKLPARDELVVDDPDAPTAAVVQLPRGRRRRSTRGGDAA